MEKRLSAAFTLLEVVIVLAVLAIALAIAIPNFSRYLNDYHISNEIEAIYSNLNYAKFYSASHQIPVNINLNANQINALTNSTNSTEIFSENLQYPIVCTNNASQINLNSFGISSSDCICYVNTENNANPNCFEVNFSTISVGRWVNGVCQK